MAFTRCDKCGELRFDKKINLCANCGHRITRIASHLSEIRKVITERVDDVCSTECSSQLEH